MPAVQPSDLGPHITNTEYSWAKDVYKEIGENFPELSAAIERVYIAEREKEEADIAAATAKLNEKDQRKAEEAARQTAIKLTSQGNDKRCVELEVELNELKEQALHENFTPDEALKEIIWRQIQDFVRQKEELYAQLNLLKDHPSDAKRFETAHRALGLLLEKITLEVDHFDFDTCEATLEDARDQLQLMQALLQGVKITARSMSEMDEERERSKQSLFIWECIDSLMGIGYNGLANKLIRNISKCEDNSVLSSDPSWVKLFDEAKECNVALGPLSKVTKFIEKLCREVNEASASLMANEILDELHAYQANPTYTISEVVSSVFALKADAIRREKFIKNQEWASANFEVRMRAYKDQLKKLVVFDDDDQIVMKKSSSQAYARAVDTEGLSKDVMIDIPKRPKDKKAKSIPRSTVDKLIESFDFLNDLQSLGVSGIETVALDEFIKVEDVLEGVHRYPGGYDKFMLQTQKMLDKISAATSGKAAIFYIEDKLKLEEDIHLLREQAASMNIGKAIRECRRLKTRELKPLLSQIISAINLKEDFNRKRDELEKIFKQIPVLLAKLGSARPEIAQKLKNVWQPKQEKIYHGELELEMLQAVAAAENATTADDLQNAIRHINRITIQAYRYLNELTARVEKLNDDLENSFSERETEFFQKIEDDYKWGVQLATERKLAKDRFNETAGPIKDELEMLTAKTGSWKSFKAKVKGFERIDEATFDPTRFSELLSELKLLEQECAASLSYEDNMKKLEALKEIYDSMRGELTGFREDIAKDLLQVAENCIARMEAAKTIVEGRFVQTVASKQDDDDEVHINKAVLKQFASYVAKSLNPGELNTCVKIISDRKKTIAERKKAREDALRIVRPLLSQLDSNKAVKLYREHPFNDVENDVNILRPLLTQLEVKLLTLAS